MFEYPYKLYGDEDPDYNMTESQSPYQNEYPTESYWAHEMSIPEINNLNDIQYKLYSENDPFYADMPSVSPLMNELPTNEYWSDFIKMQELKRDIEKAVKEKKRTKFEIGYQILMCLGGDKNPAFMERNELIDAPIDVEDGSGIGYILPPEVEKMKPEIKRRDRYVPDKQDVDILECYEDKNIDSNYIIIGNANSDLGHSNCCRNDIIEKLLLKKELFDPISEDAFIRARKKANPYETIGKAIFCNRAAVKLANIDALFNLTNSKCFKIPTVSDVDEKQEFYFADICAGPGGFTDYLYWRLRNRARGFGMTLAVEGHDWQANDAFCTDVSSFIRCYGETGNGDIYNIKNILYFQNLIKEQTKNEMVSLVTGDGGLPVDGEENEQEKITKRLILCQFLCALLILRKKGNFVCKVFDCFSDYSLSLLYVVAQCFEKFCIVKPYTSRPANSERYVVFLGLRRAQPNDVIQLLSNANEKFNDIQSKGDKEHDLMSLFPIEKIPKYFIDYVTKSNEDLAEKQIFGVDELYIYHCGSDLEPLDQNAVRIRCLNRWCVPKENSEKNKYIEVSKEQKENKSRSYVRMDKIINNSNIFQKDLQEIEKQCENSTQLGSIINEFYSGTGNRNEITPTPIFENQVTPTSPTMFSFT